MKTGRRRDDRPRTLPPERAFVVHFCAPADPSRTFEGRVEHLSSGRATHFGSRTALWAFFRELLAAARDG